MQGSTCGSLKPPLYNTPTPMLRLEKGGMQTCFPALNVSSAFPPLGSSVVSLSLL